MKAKVWMLFTGLVALGLVGSACSSPAAPTPVPAKATPTTAAPPVAAPTVAAPKPSPAGQAAPPTQTPKPTTVRYGATTGVSEAAIFDAVEKGYFKQQGLDVQLIPFQSGSMMIAPLAGGELEAGSGSVSTGLLNAIDRGVALKMVATKSSSVKGFDATWIMVRKDVIDSGRVKEPKDLKGLKGALASTKSGGEAALAYLLRSGGLTINDVEIANIAYPDMLTAFANKAIEFSLLIEPNGSAAVERGLVVRWPPGAASALYGGVYQAAELVYSEQFTKNTDAARRFMIAYLKGVRDYNEAFVKGKGRSDFVSLITKYTRDDPALYDKMQLFYIDPDGKMDSKSLNMDLAYFKEMGYYTGKLDLNSLVDNQFLDYALQELGPYK